MEIKLKCGAVAIVDDDCPFLDYDWDQIPTGHVGAFIDTVDGVEVVLLDRRVLPPSTGKIVVHVNGNRLDNRRANLRHAPNPARFTGRTRSGRSGILGVQYIPESSPNRPWRSQIHVENHNYHLGSFKTKDEAVAMRQAAELAFYGELRCVVDA